MKFSTLALKKKYINERIIIIEKKERKRRVFYYYHYLNIELIMTKAYSED